MSIDTKKGFAWRVFVWQKIALFFAGQGMRPRLGTLGYFGSVGHLGEVKQKQCNVVYGNSWETKMMRWDGMAPNVYFLDKEFSFETSGSLCDCHRLS